MSTTRHGGHDGKGGIMYLLETGNRQSEYRNRSTAIRIAEQTGGEFIDEVFHDKFGDYWIVIWRAR